MTTSSTVLRRALAVLADDADISARVTGVQ
jgi:hypothetical protein